MGGILLGNRRMVGGVHGNPEHEVKKKKSKHVTTTRLILRSLQYFFFKSKSYFTGSVSAPI